MKKIPTLFERVFENHKIVDVSHNITEGCETAFLYGTPTIKVDGSCCAIINGVFFKRYDAKHGKPIPYYAIKCQEEPDPITGHMPCWIPCDYGNNSDKWFFVAKDTYIFHNQHISDGTYEAIGKHFNGNPYNIENDILVKHGSVIIYDLQDRTFESVKQWLETHNEEGIVFWLNGEPICKIKRTDFGLSWNKR